MSNFSQNAQPNSKEQKFEVNWNKTNQELKHWLEQYAPEMVAPFEGALLLLTNPEIPGRINFISHAIRDLISSLPNALDGSQETTQHGGAIYRSKIEAVKNAWPSKITRELAGQEILLPQNAVGAVDDLLECFEAIRSQQTSGQKLARVLVNASEVPSSESTQRLIHVLERERKWFVGLAHFNANSSRAVEESELRKHVDSVFGAIHAVIGSYYVGVSEIDKILEENDYSELAKLEPLIASQHHARYFFERLNSPEWIEALNAIGVFREVPPVEEVENGLRHPLCPALVYLERMVEHRPELVANILAEIDSENINAVSTLVNVSKSLSPEHQSLVHARLIETAKKQRFGVYAIDVADIIVGLCDRGESGVAFSLMRPLLHVDSLEPYSSTHPIRWYFQIWDKVWVKLLECDPIKFLKFVIHNIYVVNECKVEEKWDGVFDASFIWRPAIEEHSENSDHAFESNFIGAASIVFEKAIQDGLVSLQDLIRLLENKSPRILFQRIRIHLIAEFGGGLPELASAILLHRETFEDYRLKHEYAQLCRKQFGPLSEEKQAEWFAWIDAGPDMSNFDKSFEQGTGNKPTDSDRNARVGYWQLEKLSIVKDHLAGSQLEKYQQLLAVHGEPTLVDMNIRTHGFWGSTSPLTTEQSTAMAFPELIDYVSNWKPERGIGEPSFDGLQRTFSDYVSHDRNTYIEQADLLIERPLGFVRSFLDCVSGTQELTADVSKALDLCDWVITTSILETDDGNVYRASEVTDSVSRFIRSICNRDVSIDFRDRIWSISEQLTRFEGDSYILESDDFDARVRDFRLSAINSPSGHAMQAVFAYAKWVTRILFGDNHPESGLNDLPEVRDLMEARLTNNDTGGFNLRALIGQNAQLLRFLDRDWFLESRNRIFEFDDQNGDPNRGLGWAAWNTFIYESQPNVEIFNDLQDQYREIANRVESVVVDDANRDDPFSRVGKHLVILFLRGQIPLHGEDSILEVFLRKAPGEIRSRVLDFVGVVLANEDGPPDAEIMTRYEDLWEWYWHELGKVDAAKSPRSSTFGMWFISENLQPAWALKHLAEFVSVVASPEPDHEIFSVLAKICTEEPEASLNVLRQLVVGYPENWQIHAAREDINSVLSQLQVDGNLQELKTEIVDLLGRRGFTEFRDHLN